MVDKDSTTGLLAEALDADMLLVLTDVAAVEAGDGDARRPGPSTGPRPQTCGALCGSPPDRWAPRSKPSAGSSSCTGGTAAIGSLRDVDAILAGKACTIVTPSGLLTLTPGTVGRVTSNRAHGDAAATLTFSVPSAEDPKESGTPNGVPQAAGHNHAASPGAGRGRGRGIRARRWPRA